MGINQFSSLDIITNWVWSENGWLAKMGVMDYAG
jgi:ammonia channel protein AmtB